MAKAKYRLQVVLDKREREKDEAVRRVSDAKKRVEFEEKKLEKLIEMRLQVDERKQACTAQFHAKLDKPEPGMDLGFESQSHDRYQLVLDEEARNHDKAIVGQKMVIEGAKQKVKEAEAELLKATINVQAMEKHKEEWAKQVKLEELAKEQERQEELGEAMWLQNRRAQQRRYD